MFSILPSLLPLLVAISTWMTPLSKNSQGLLVYYGNDHLAKANAEYRGYDISFYKDECGLAVMSPADLGKIVWIRTSETEWYGPCLAVDVGAQHDFYHLVYKNKEIAEITTTLRDRLGFENGKWGQIYVGYCPPPRSLLEPEFYRPPLVWATDTRRPYIEWPRQQLPRPCAKNGQVIVITQSLLKQY